MENKTISRSIITESSDSEDSSVYGIKMSDTKRFWNYNKKTVSSDHQNVFSIENKESFSKDECQSDSALGSSDKEFMPQANKLVANKNTPMNSSNNSSSSKKEDFKPIHIAEKISNKGYIKNVVASSHKRKSSTSPSSRSRSSDRRNRRRCHSTSSESSNYGSSERKKKLRESSQNKSSSRTSREHSREKGRRTDNKQLEQSKSHTRLKSVIEVVKPKKISHSEEYNKESRRTRHEKRNINYESFSNKHHIKPKEHHPSHSIDKSKSICHRGSKNNKKIDISNRNGIIQKKHSPCSFKKDSKEFEKKYNNLHRDQIRNCIGSYRNSSTESRILQGHLYHSSSPSSNKSCHSMNPSLHEHYSRDSQDYIRYGKCNDIFDIPMCRGEHRPDHDFLGSSSNSSSVSTKRSFNDLPPQRSRRPALLPTPSLRPSQITCCCSSAFNQDFSFTTSRRQVSPAPRQQQRQVPGPGNSGIPNSTDWNLACKVYVGGLSKDATRQQLKKAFIRFGELQNLWLAKNPPGFGFVEFENEEEARAAVREDGRLRVGGTLVKIEMSWTPYSGKKEGKKSEINPAKVKEESKVNNRRSVASSSSRKTTILSNP